MAHTEPTYDLPHQIKLEFCQIESPPDEDTRRIEIGERGMITSGEWSLCSEDPEHGGRRHSHLSSQRNFAVARAEQLPVCNGDKRNVPANFKLAQRMSQPAAGRVRAYSEGFTTEAIRLRAG